MRLLPVLLVGVFLIGLLPGVAAAQERPNALPTRDVDVLYRSEPGGAASGTVVEQRSRFSAAAQRTRLDLPTPGLFSILDYRTHTRSRGRPADQKVGQPTGPAPPAPDWVRRGQDQVAGLPCTEWEARDSLGQPALTCFTGDGVMLRVRRGPQVLAVATRVTYATQPAELFVVPPEFERVRRATAPNTR